MLKKYKYFKLFFFVFAFAFTGHIGYAQEQVDTTSSGEIIIRNSDNTKIIKENEEFIRHLNGNVQIFHDSTFFYADTAILKGKKLFAKGNIVIIQNDSIRIFSDSLFYDGDSSKAELIGKVFLENGEKELRTQHLYYDVKNKISRYETGAILKQKTSELTSVKGVYYINENLINFNEYVAIKDSSFILHTDSLDFDSKERIAFFLGPTLIEQDSSIIYCETGYYNIKNRNALFEENMTYKKGDVKASSDKMYYSDSLSTYTLTGNAKYNDNDNNTSADTIIHNTQLEVSTLIGNAVFEGKSQKAKGNKIIYSHKSESMKAIGRSTIDDSPMQITADNTEYSKKTGKGIASGNVVFVDTTSNIVINSSKMFLEKENDYMLAYGDSTARLMMMFIAKNDTTYLSSDTLISTNIVTKIDSLNNDTIKILKAFNNVKIYNKDYQSRSDSLSYFPDDSLYVLFNDPVLWSDSTQITGDTISIWSRGEGIDRILSRNNAFVTNIIAEKLFNQIKGIKTTLYFKNDSLNSMDVNGNAETVYHMEDDDGALTGTIKTVCSKIGFTFKNNQIEGIKFYGVPKSDFVPIKKEIRNPHVLDGFKWLENKRPKTKDDVLILVDLQDNTKLKSESESDLTPNSNVKKTQLKKSVNDLKTEKDLK